MNHPLADPVPEDVGDVAHHTACVEDYDHVLFVLNQMKELLGGES